MAQAQIDRLTAISDDVFRWLAVALPVSLMFGNAGPEFVGALIAIGFVGRSVIQNDWSWLSEKWVQALLVLWLYTVVQAIVTGAPRDSLLASVGWVRFVLLAVALSHWLLTDKIWFDRLVYATAATIGIFAVDCWVQYVRGFDLIGRPIAPGNRLTAMLNRPRAGSAMAWIYLPAVLGLVSRGHRILAVVLGLLTLSAIAITGDRMPMLAAIAMLVLALPFLGVPRRWLLGALALIGVGVAVLGTARPDVYARQITSVVESLQRVPQTAYGIAWTRAEIMVRDSPVFGVGLGRYYDRCQDPKYGPATVRNDRNHEYPTCFLHPHNVYLEWAVETGVVGLSLFVAAVIFLFRDLFVNIRATRTSMVFVGLLAVLIVRLFPISTAPSMLRGWFAVPLFLAVGWALAIGRMTKNSKARIDEI